MTAPTFRPVLLVHGLWTGSWTLLALARRLRARGIVCHRFDYPTVRDGPAAAASRLCAEVARIAADGECDIVAHSLGGIVALHALGCAPDTAVRRVVCLGAPLCGSTTAITIAAWPVAGPLLGSSREWLCRSLPDWHGRAQVGVIAGATPLGLGRIAGRLPPPHDGTVTVEETRLPGLTDHVVLPTTHTGMLFSAPVAAQVVAFLGRGRFDH